MKPFYKSWNVLLFAFLISCLLSCRSNRNNLPEQGSPIPSLDIQLLDSVSILNTTTIPLGKTVVFIYFRPNCPHCKKETITLLANMDILQKTQFYFITPMPLEELKIFYESYGLKDFQNITAARDYDLAFYKYFNPQDVPYILVYNPQKKLERLLIGEIESKLLIESVKG